MDLSIVIPAIRPDRWVNVYESAKLSCTRYSFEIIFIGPYDPPDELKDNPQIKYIKDYGTSCRCAQIGVLDSTAPIFARMDDDGLFFPDGLDQAIDQYNSVDNKDMICLRYREGFDHGGATFELWYYFAKNAFHTQSMLDENPHKHSPEMLITLGPAFEKLHIPEHYLNAPVCLMSKDYFIEMGGYDCVFEHLAWGSHDFCYRLQRSGGVIHFSPIEVSNIDHYGGYGGDHTPVEHAVHQHDGPLLKQMQLKPDIVNRIKIDINNWNDSPEVWTRRFGTEVKGFSHPELLVKASE